MNHDIGLNDYDRISDQLVWFSDSIKLSFVVALSSKDRSGARRSFYFETEYDSKYIGTDIARGIKRNMRFYYVLETSDYANGLLLRPHDVYFLTHIIEKRVLPWFFGNQSIYQEKDNKLIISGKYEPVAYQPYPNQYLLITPIVLETNEGFIQGLRLEVCNQILYCDTDINRFIDFYNILKCTDMYAVACSMINFVKMPPHGENVFKRVGLGAGANPNEGWNNNYNLENHSNNGTAKTNEFLSRKR